MKKILLVVSILAVLLVSAVSVNAEECEIRSSTCSEERASMEEEGWSCFGSWPMFCNANFEEYAELRGAFSGGEVVCEVCILE